MTEEYIMRFIRHGEPTNRLCFIDGILHQLWVMNDNITSTPGSKVYQWIKVASQ